MGERAQNLSKVIIVVFTLGMVLFVTGFATDYWSDDDVTHRGLWRRCTLGVCTEGGFTDVFNVFKDDNLSWFEATQAFETLGFIAAVAALVLIVLYIFVPATSGKRIVFILCMLACFAAAGCIILGIIIYGAKVKDNLSWSYALCTIAGIIFGVSGILLIVDMLQK